MLFAIPIIGWIALIICACSGSNINRRSYARSYFCGIILILIAVVIIGLLAVVGGNNLGTLIETIKEYISQLLPQIG